MTILRMIVMSLLRDLGLAYSLSEVVPRIQHRQVGDIDWVAFTRRVTGSAVTPALLEQLEFPHLPIIGPGSAIEQKVTGVLETYRTFFSDPYQVFLPPGPHVKGHAIIFKVC
jgi:hypothetical protein